MKILIRICYEVQLKVVIEYDYLNSQHGQKCTFNIVLVIDDYAVADQRNIYLVQCIDGIYKYRCIEDIDDDCGYAGDGARKVSGQAEDQYSCFRSRPHREYKVVSAVLWYERQGDDDEYGNA